MQATKPLVAGMSAKLLHGLREALVVAWLPPIAVRLVRSHVDELALDPRIWELEGMWALPMELYERLPKHYLPHRVGEGLVLGLAQFPGGALHQKCHYPQNMRYSITKGACGKLDHDLENF